MKIIFFVLWLFGFLGACGTFLSCKAYAEKWMKEKNIPVKKNPFSIRLTAYVMMGTVAILPIVNLLFTYLFVVKSEFFYEAIEEKMNAKRDGRTYLR